MRYLGAFVLLAVLLLGACDGQAQPTPAAPAEREEVSIFDFGYDPATLTISVGESVIWTNDGPSPHTVTFDEGPDSGSFSTGETFEHTFDSAGEFTYICTIHPAMRGVVNVGP